MIHDVFRIIVPVGKLVPGVKVQCGYAAHSCKQAPQAVENFV